MGGFWDIHVKIDCVLKPWWAYKMSVLVSLNIYRYMKVVHQYAGNHKNNHITEYIGDTTGMH